ncbi:MAG TPA: non-heme iron oxygenase ferredoxin subunit [Terriglobia bacterium]|nr:non-heme iron oxygenase ferredoxin subunit [Terriglobia bacterium]
MPKTVKVAQTSELSLASGKVVEAEGRSIALFNVEGTFYAIDNTCTHRGGPLGEGELNGEIVTCPWHGANFNVKTGAVTGPPAGTGVHSFVVKVEAGDVLVELE